MFAGIDTHKDTLAAAVVDPAGRLVGQLEVTNTEAGFADLVELFETHQVVQVGIEGSGNFGRAVAIHLLLVWTPDRAVGVVEVPTLMTSRQTPGQAWSGQDRPGRRARDCPHHRPGGEPAAGPVDCRCGG